MMFELEEVRRLVARAVLTQPTGFRYRPLPLTSSFMCLYRTVDDVDEHDHRGRTGCLVGTALTLGGATEHLDPLFDHDGVSEMAHSIGDDFLSEDAIDYLDDVQVAQDRGDTWIESYEWAEAILRHRLSG